MDPPQYTNYANTSLLEALAEVPDPRKERGKQHEWRIVMAVLCGALASGQRSVRAVAQWVKEHSTEITQQLRPSKGHLPSASTLYRAVRAIDVATLEAQLIRYSQGVEATCQQEGCVKAQSQWIGQSVDGKEVRGARAHGHRICLVSLVRHDSGVVLGQQAVKRKSNEIKAVPYLLQGQDLNGTVTTMDALLTQRTIAQQIVAGGGHYLMVVKGNQPEAYLAIEELFGSVDAGAPPWLAHEQEASYRHYSKVEKGHGRVEKRTLESSQALRECVREYLRWPGGEQVLRRTCQRVVVKTGEISEKVTYGITSLKWEEAHAQELERLWRGHWTIENRVHYVRDVTMGEDANQMRAGQAPQVLAALRNGIVNLIRKKGWTNVADALRHYGAATHRALQLLSSP